MAPSIEKRARFDRIRYANCWEDADVLVAALAPDPGERFLSIASGGDNSLALLATGASVVAVDLSPDQLAVVELKAAAIRRLPRNEVLELLGFRASAQRDRLLDAVRDDLSRSTADYWHDRRAVLRKGLVHAGKFERFFRVFRRFVLPLVHSPARVRELMAEKTEAERHDFYARRWDSRRWRWMFRLFFSRFVMGHVGRDPEFFRYVEGSVADRILERTRYAFTVLPTHSNPYLEYILTSAFTHNLPSYLAADTWDRLRANLDSLTLLPGDAVSAAASAGGRFDGFNLSDIFEYLGADVCRDIYGALLDVANPGARFAYWNMLVPRSCPAELAARVDPCKDRAAALFARDRAFFYSSFVLEVVR